MTDRPNRCPFLTALATRRAWSELAFALLGLLLGVAAFTYAVTMLTTSAGLLVIFVGLPLLAASGLGAAASPPGS